MSPDEVSDDDAARARTSMDAVTAAIDLLASGDPDAATAALACVVNVADEPDRALFGLACAATMCAADELRSAAGDPQCSCGQDHAPEWLIDAGDGEIDEAPSEAAAAMRAVTAACNRNAHLLSDVLVAFYRTDGTDGFARLLPSLVRLCVSIRSTPPIVFRESP